MTSGFWIWVLRKKFNFDVAEICERIDLMRTYIFLYLEDVIQLR